MTYQNTTDNQEDRRARVVQFALLFSSAGQIPHGVRWAGYYRHAISQTILQERNVVRLENVSLNDTFATFIDQGYHIASVEYYSQRKSRKYPYRMIVTLKLDATSIASQQAFLINMGQWIYEKCAIRSADDILTIKCSGAHHRETVEAYVNAGFIFPKKEKGTPKLSKLEDGVCALLSSPQ